jgi:hypothetical protein
MTSSLPRRKESSLSEEITGQNSTKAWRHYWRPATYWICIAVPLLIWTAIMLSACQIPSESGFAQYMDPSQQNDGSAPKR